MYDEPVVESETFRIGEKEVGESEAKEKLKELETHMTEIPFTEFTEENIDLLLQ